MNRLMQDFLEQRLSRRHFVQALAALGVSATGVESLARAAEAVAQGTSATLGQTVTGTGGELFVAQMKAAGVRYLFTNPGSFEVGFFDAFLGQPGMTLIMGLHEGLVIAMADGYHKVSREPAFVNVHVIAGTAQAAGQLYNASRDGSALVITAALLDNEAHSDELLLGPRPGFNQKDITRQFTKMAWESHHGDSVAMMLRRAFKVATTEPGGPVYLAIPNTILEGKATADVYDRSHFLIPGDIPPDPGRVTQVARLLLEAKSPALVFGDEVAKAGAQPEGLELAELLGLPVHEHVLPAFHSFPRHHSLFKGQFSGKGKDVVVNVGDYDLGDFDFREDTAPLPSAPSYERGAKVVRIGLNTQAIGRNNPFDVVMVANVKLTMRALIEALKSEAPAAALKKLREARWSEPAARKVAIDPGRVGNPVIHPDELGWTLQQLLDGDAIVVSENLSGSNHFLSTGFRANEKLWISNSAGGLGWGIGAATGAKLAAPDRQVVCNIGDGSVMYGAAGFWTQARHEVPVLTVVCNNRNYQTVRLAFWRYQGEMAKTDRYPGMHLGSPNIDFVKLAESQGVAGVRVEKSGDLRRALQEGIDTTRGGQPFLVEVVVQKVGGGAGSEWYQEFSLAKSRKRDV
jgi:benzoylformate decarboxylase